MSLDVTIAMTLRETISPTIGSLESALKYSPEDVEIVIVASGVSTDLMQQLENLAANRNVRIIRQDSYLTPNQARNLVAREINSRYIAFVDNDIVFSENWLEALVTCAEEEDAAIVGPLIYERFPPFRYIHLAGGVAEIHAQPDGGRHYFEKHNYQHFDTNGTVPELERSETSLVEFHTMLVETAFFRKAGGLDEGLLSYSEHWDFCMQALEQGEKIFFEPASRVTYLPPLEPTEEDLRFFDLRWSYEWYEASLDRLIKKYDLTPEAGSLRFTDGFMKTHRLHKYGHTRKKLTKVFGRKLSNIIMNRVVSLWDKLKKSPTFHDDYKLWKSHTEGLNEGH